MKYGDSLAFPMGKIIQAMRSGFEETVVLTPGDSGYCSMKWARGKLSHTFQHSPLFPGLGWLNRPGAGKPPTLIATMRFPPLSRCILSTLLMASVSTQAAPTLPGHALDRRGFSVSREPSQNNGNRGPWPVFDQARRLFPQEPRHIEPGSVQASCSTAQFDFDSIMISDSLLGSVDGCLPVMVAHAYNNSGQDESLIRANIVPSSCD